MGVFHMKTLIFTNKPDLLECLTVRAPIEVAVGDGFCDMAGKYVGGVALCLNLAHADYAAAYYIFSFHYELYVPAKITKV